MEFRLASGFSGNRKDRLNGNGLGRREMVNKGKRVRVGLGVDLLGGGELKLKLNKKRVGGGGRYSLGGENK